MVTQLSALNQAQRVLQGSSVRRSLTEGTKNKSLVCLANSNPDICRAFIQLLRKTYPIQEEKFRCHLRLRLDQKAKTEIQFWSKLLKIPPTKFLKSQHDSRSIGKPTTPGYHGVCAIYYYDASIQKNILALGQAFLDHVLKGN